LIEEVAGIEGCSPPVIGIRKGKQVLEEVIPKQSKAALPKGLSQGGRYDN